MLIKQLWIPYVTVRIVR